MCKRYGILPSEAIQNLDPFWIDFNTAVALKGQLEQNKLEEEEMKKMERERGRKGSHEPISQERLAEKRKRAQTIDDILKERRALKAEQDAKQKAIEQQALT